MVKHEGSKSSKPMSLEELWRVSVDSSSEGTRDLFRDLEPVGREVW